MVMVVVVVVKLGELWIESNEGASSGKGEMVVVVAAVERGGVKNDGCSRKVGR